MIEKKIGDLVKVEKSPFSKKEGFIEVYKVHPRLPLLSETDIAEVKLPAIGVVTETYEETSRQGQTTDWLKVLFVNVHGWLPASFAKEAERKDE